MSIPLRWVRHKVEASPWPLSECGGKRRLFVSALSSVIAFFFANGAALAAPTLLWVSPTGSDTQGSGTEAAPWQTVQHARDQIRSNHLNAATQPDDIVVNLAAGEYRLASPVAFVPADSGANGHAIIYRSATGPGAAHFLGGDRITGWVKSAANPNIWQASVPNRPAAHTLYENGRRAHVAREPNAEPDPRYPGYFGPYLRSAGGSATSISYHEWELHPSRWRAGPPGELWWWGNEGKRNWGMLVRPITALDPAAHAIRFDFEESPATAGERYFVQGYFELLDAPGEFYWDEAKGEIYYWPMDGDPNRQQILAPRLGEIFHLEGSAVGQPVHDLKFEGLAVSCTDFTAGSVKDIGAPRAAFFLEHASRIEIRDCHLFNLGNLGMRILQDAEHDVIAGCWIERAGEGGIQIWDDLLRAQHPAGRSEHHLIADCRIDDFTEVRTTSHWCGVQLFCTNDCEVANCEIFNSGRYAISLRGNYSTESKGRPDSGRHPAVGNGFHHLRIWRCGGDSGDMGAVHAAQVNPTGGPNLNTWEQIVISDVEAHSSMDDVAPNGIFLDHAFSCENQILKNIEVARTQGLPFRTNQNPHESLSNVSWEIPFDEGAMDYRHIGLTADFPAAFKR